MSTNPKLLRLLLKSALGAAITLATAGIAWAGTAHTVSVTATGGALSAGVVGDDLTASVSADVADPPDVTDETTISGPVWTWSVVDAQWFNPAAQAFEASSYYTVFFDNDDDSSQPGATIHVTLLRSGTWDITVQAAVHYSQPCSDGSLNTWDGSGLADVTGTVTLGGVDIQAARNGTGQFGHSAKIAAGGMTPGEHYADVQITVTNSANQAVMAAGTLALVFRSTAAACRVSPDAFRSTEMAARRGTGHMFWTTRNNRPCARNSYRHVPSGPCMGARAALLICDVSLNTGEISAGH
jgi:hypothetical protein